VSDQSASIRLSTEHKGRRRREPVWIGPLPDRRQGLGQGAGQRLDQAQSGAGRLSHPHPATFSTTTSSHHQLARRYRAAQARAALGRSRTTCHGGMRLRVARGSVRGFEEAQHV
jgi:hypothetical protein